MDHKRIALTINQELNIFAEYNDNLVNRLNDAGARATFFIKFNYQK